MKCETIENICLVLYCSFYEEKTKKIRSKSGRNFVRQNKNKTTTK